MAMVRQLSPKSIALTSTSRVPHREPQTTCGQKTLILYTASGYIDQQTKKFIRRGRDACLEELKEKYGVKISGSTLDRIVRMGKEAKGGVVCLERKKYDRSNKSHLTEEVKEDYVELITEFAHTWRRLTIRHLHLLMQGKGYEFCKSTVSNHLHAMNMRYKTIHLKPILTERVRMWRIKFALSLIDISRGDSRGDSPRRLLFKPLWDYVMADEKWY